MPQTRIGKFVVAVSLIIGFVLVLKEGWRWHEVQNGGKSLNINLGVDWRCYSRLKNHQPVLLYCWLAK